MSIQCQSPKIRVHTSQPQRTGSAYITAHHLRPALLLVSRRPHLQGHQVQQHHQLHLHCLQQLLLSRRLPQQLLRQLLLLLLPGLLLSLRALLAVLAPIRQHQASWRLAGRGTAW